MTHEKVLVTGGAGFVGSHLCEALLREGRSVTVIDDLSTGRWANIDHLKRDPHFRVIMASATERALVTEEVARHDLVYHLASAVGVKLIIEQPVRTVETIFHGTDVVLNACARYHRPVLITSTSEVYGKSERIPFREDADVVMGPTSKRRWAYACAKALDEFLALAHHYQSHLPVYIVRLFNTVGPRQTGQYGMVVPSFVRQALSDRPLTVYGDGTQRRCFCSVHDVVDGLLRLPANEAAAGQVVNLGTQEEISILGLAERVIDLCGSRSTIDFVPYEEAYGAGFDDMMRRVPDTRRAAELIGWDPAWRLDDIIQEIAGLADRPAPLLADVVRG
ncbi:NAD-dependent epimerase/dehydratase family protein [Geodermatophilus sp. CPCC 206100]|uniref:NAD-dependent epimerase/dehydratase family protein n=1 Tax=Geodermatophilus sp. CPCC 206100 TaxID=3020054 RepID=UPI003B005E49